jgi:phosphate transport system permease protein
MQDFPGIATVVACVPLFSVLVMLVWRGGKKLSLQLFTELPPTAFESGGGFGNAIIGTLVIVANGGAISVPAGVLTAVFLAEFGAASRTASVSRFCTKTLTGLPSILAGVFAYTAGHCGNNELICVRAWRPNLFRTGI